MKKLALAATLGCALAAMPALAADADSNTDTNNPVTKQDCRVIPNADGGKAANEDPGEDQAMLADKLDRCNGVLAPPKTGDTEMTEPAPDTGETPVIPPDQVPQQAPKE